MTSAHRPPTNSTPADRPIVAFDTGPLHGHRTGVGRAVAALRAQYAHRDDLEVIAYVLSARARLDPGERRLGLPAALAMRIWSYSDHPRADRWLRGADVIHGTNYSAPPSKLPTVISVYDTWFLRNTDLAAPAVARAARVLARAVERGAWIHSSSEATSQQVRALLSTDRVVTIHLGPPDDAEPVAMSGTSHLSTSAFAGRRYVLAIGTIERRKNLPALIDAFGLDGFGPDRRSSAEPVHVILAGAPGDDQAALDRAIERLPHTLRGRVHVLGSVDTATKARLFAGASALVYPSLDEGFGFPILEAQRAGVPVIATDTGSIPEIGGAGVHLVPLGDTTALAKAVTAVVDDESQRDALIAAGRANLTRFDWRATADQLIALYHRAIDAH